jgi:recombination protein RecA
METSSKGTSTTTMTKLDEVMARLNPKTLEMFRKASEIEHEYLMTPSLGINMATGGLRYGAIHTIWGGRSAGKSMLCLGLVREAQKLGKSCAWVDAEKNFDPIWARRHGVDTDDLFVSHTTSMVDTANNSVDLVKNGVDLLIIDSMSVQLPQSYFDDGEIKGLEGTNQIGTFAKNYASMMNMLNNLNKHTCIVIVSQVRNKFHQYGASKSLMGGEAAEFMNSTIIKMWAPLTDKDTIKGTITQGNLILERPIGRPVTWTIDKSRGPGMGQSNSYDMYFAGDNVGIDLTGEVVDFGVEFGVIKKGGAWYTVGEERFQGRAKLVAWLKENPDVQEKLYHQILEATA